MSPKRTTFIPPVTLLAMDIDRRMTAPVVNHPTLTIHRGVTVRKVFHPILMCLEYAGFFLVSKLPEELLNTRQKCALALRRGLCITYMALMWIWVTVITVNIFWMAIVVTAQSGTDPTNGQRSNVIITFLEESPYCLLALRNAIILTQFVSLGPQVFNALTICEELRKKLIQDGADPDLLKSLGKRPLLFVIASITVIALWEAYEWSVWFNVPALGPLFRWEMSPFPFVLIHYQYAILWWLFVSIPFIFSQLAICVPAVFAFIVTAYCRYLNSELRRLAQPAQLVFVCHAGTTGEESHDRVSAQRISELRKIHFQIIRTVRLVDKTVRSMLLVQFLFDIVVLFAFLGLCLESKYAIPRKPTLEWSFYLPTSAVWVYLLMHYNMPLVLMTAEGEKTHALVHALTFIDTGTSQKVIEDFTLFLEESRHAILGFTGRKFYYVNRAYIATCAAVTASYFTVLSEILDRFYGTEEIKKELAGILDFLRNNTANSSQAIMFGHHERSTS